MKRFATLLTIGALLSALAGPDAWARGPNAEAEGKKRYARGTELFLQGKYLEAAHEFEAGFAAVPRAFLFLYNIGNSYRRAGELAKAKRYYQQLLQQDPNFTKRASVEADIKAIDDALSLSEPAAAPAPEPVVEAPAPPPPGAAPPPVAPVAVAPSEPAPVAVPVTPPPRRRVAARTAPPPEAPMPLIEYRPDSAPAEPPPSESVFSKPWFWVIIGAVVAGGAAAAFVGLRKDNSCPGTLCLTETRQ